MSIKWRVASLSGAHPQELLSAVDLKEQRVVIASNRHESLQQGASLEGTPLRHQQLAELAQRPSEDELVVLGLSQRDRLAQRRLALTQRASFDQLKSV